LGIPVLGYGQCTIFQYHGLSAKLAQYNGDSSLDLPPDRHMLRMIM